MMEISVTQYLLDDIEKYPAMIKNYQMNKISYIRINITTEDYTFYSTHIKHIMSAAKKLNHRIELLFDLAYPGKKFRVQTRNNGGIKFKYNDELSLSYKANGNDNDYDLYLSSFDDYKKFIQDKQVIFDDSKYIFDVVEADNKRLIIRAKCEGEIKNYKSIYSEKNIYKNDSGLDAFFNKNFLFFLKETKPTGLILSFCEKGETIRQLRNFLNTHIEQLEIIPKIETKEAIDNLEDIAKHASIAMLGRGDLGILEKNAANLLSLQNIFFEVCKKYNLKTIVATDILRSFESGQYIPNRAEIIDFSLLKQNADIIVVSAFLAMNEEKLNRFVEFAEKVFK